MIIQRIVNLDSDTHFEFCRWLRQNEGTTISDLIKDSGVAQDRMLTKFMIDTGRIKSNASN